MAVQPRDHRLQQERLSLLAAMLHGPRDGMPTGDRVVTVHLLARNAKSGAAVDDPLLAMLGAGGRRNSPLVIHHNHQHRQFIAWPRAPDQAGSEVTFGCAGFAAHDDGNAVAAVALLHNGRTWRHGELHFDY